jgi:superfamily II DNA or RNA helicase
MIQLREYQNKIIDSLRNSIRNGNKRVILCAPTGGGKTVIFSFMVSEHVKKGGKVLILTHRSELFKQSTKTFFNFGLEVEKIDAGSKPDLSKNLHVAMIETISRRSVDYELFLSERTMIVIDEAHLTTFNKLFDFISPKTFVIGATATPLRTGKQPCLSEFYSDLIQEVDTPDLIKDGFLCQALTYGVPIQTKGLKKVGEDYDTKQYFEENKTYKGVVDNYLRLVAGKKTILFASNVESSKEVCQEFNDRGIEARHIDGETPEKQRSEALEWFKNTPTAIICNCGILNAGYDEPTIEAVILYRATTSLPLFLQMVGRGSRTTKNKQSFYLLDFGNNVQRFDFWETRRIWDLKKAKKRNTIGASPVTDCKNCGAIISNKAKGCDYCGYALPDKEKFDDDEIAELKLLSTAKLMNDSDIYEKVKMVKSGVLKAFYVLHQLKTKDEAILFCKLMGYKDGFLYQNAHRFKILQ